MQRLVEFPLTGNVSNRRGRGKSEDQWCHEGELFELHVGIE